MRQKAAIAIGLVRPFELLLVDEPFVGLDVTGREAMLVLLDQAHAAGAAVVVATHDVEFAAAVAGRVVLLGEGTVIPDGPPAGAGGMAALDPEPSLRDTPIDAEAHWTPDPAKVEAAAESAAS